MAARGHRTDRPQRWAVAWTPGPVTAIVFAVVVAPLLLSVWVVLKFFGALLEILEERANG